MSKETKEDAMRLVQAASDAMTDGMVERLTTTTGNVLEVADRLNDEDTKDAIQYTLDRLTEAHRSGSLETLFDLVALVHGARSALTDSMVERLVIWAETMVSNVANEDLAEFAGETVDAMHEAAVETANTQCTGGLFKTMNMLTKPETQQALTFMLAFAEKMQNNATGNKD